MAISCIWCIRPSRDVTCGCTYEAVVIEDGLARPVLLNADSEIPKAAWRAKRNGPRTLEYGCRGDRLCEERYWVGDGRNL